MTNKEKYQSFCKSTYIPVFSQPWWMDAVCGEDNWDVFVVEKGGIYVAAMPYYHEERNGYQLITKAKNTQNNGIIIKYPTDQKYTTKLGYEEAIINEIIDYIESLGLDKYEQQYHYSFTNWLPFFWRYYSEITRYTYVIENTEDMAQVEKGYSSSLRNCIRKGQKIVHISEKDILLDEFYKINRMSFERQGKEIPYSFDFVKRIYEAGKKQQAVKIMAAEDEKGNIHSVAFLVWDEEAVYFLLNGTNPEFKNSQANCYLIHESIKVASGMGKIFDFEGSVIKPIEKMFREYGGIRKPYFRIYKTFNKELKQLEMCGGGGK